MRRERRETWPYHPIMDRARFWLAVAPIVGAGVLAAHALAYRITGTAAGPAHAYLDHAPQVLLVLALVGASLAVLGTRLRAPSAWLAPTAAVATFAIQEHVERLAHTGEPALVATSPAFLVGLVLQLPVALVVWALARWLLGTLDGDPARRPVLQRLGVPLVELSSAEFVRVPAPPLPARGPPSVHRR